MIFFSENILENIRVKNDIDDIKVNIFILLMREFRVKGSCFFLCRMVVRGSFDLRIIEI